MIEEWRDIEGYEGIYKVSNLGNVLNVQFNRLLKQCVRKSGYKQVTLCKIDNNVRTQRVFKVHRLVLQAFIPNIDNLPEINHKDENKANNRLDNLEWCSHQYNINYGSRNKKVSDALKGHKMFIDPAVLNYLSHLPEVEQKRKLTRLRYKNGNK